METVGLEPGKYLDVDDSLRVRGSDWLYGVGDVNGRKLLTHMGKYQAGRRARRSWRGRRASRSRWPTGRRSSPPPTTPRRRPSVFTDPQVASVGLTSVEAAKRELPHRVVEYAIGNVAGASVFADGYTGTAIAVIDTEREVLLGMTFIGSGVAEMIQAATIAIVGEVPIARLWHAVPAYPTINEVWLRLLETYRG